jgi:hypothetical protein
MLNLLLLFVVVESVLSSGENRSWRSYTKGTMSFPALIETPVLSISLPSEADSCCSLNSFAKDQAGRCPFPQLPKRAG